jgi:hypothetical protein
MVAFDSAGFLASLKSVAEVIAIAVGGAWTYRLFIKGRGDFPRASITHRITHKPLTNGLILVRVTVGFANPGTVLLRVGKGLVRLSRVRPLPDDVVPSVEDGKRTIELPEIASRELEADVVEIEPGESDEVDFDFVVREDIEAVEVYSYFRNPSRADREIGWTLATLYDLKDEAPPVERTVERLSGRSRDASPTAAAT